MDFLLPYWNPLIVHPLEQGLRMLAAPLETVMSPGLAGGLAIIFFTIVLRVVLLPLSLVQIRSQRHQLAIQPELKELQRRFKGDREGMARAQMQLYKDRGVNPAAGCIPLLIQLPILFGMYSAMSQLATMGLTLDQVTANSMQPGRIVYAAERRTDPLPFNQFELVRLEVIPKDKVQIDAVQADSSSSFHGKQLLNTTQSLTLTPGVPPGNINPPSTPSGTASIFFRAGKLQDDGSIDRNAAPVVGQPYIVEVWVDASGTNADVASVTATYDAALLDVTHVETPKLQDVAFKSRFLWLPSLGEPDLIHFGGLGIPGVLLIIMTITSFVSQRMTTLPSDDPQQQAMMRSMAFMPLMYLFFFLNTPAGLVLYWLISNVFSMFQQYFTIGLGMLGGDVMRFTGRDLQPPWAHVPTTAIRPSDDQGPAGNGRGPRGPNGRYPSDGTTPAPGSRATARSRSGGSKGRKRGKR
ncbi:MAG TPA: YidC/Oxa1 family membrane protein insertase [Chloroflexota bacterium]